MDMHLARAVLGLLALAFTSQGLSVEASPRPVTPNASPEAVQLLQYLYDISGKQTIVGQHAAPLVATTQLRSEERRVGKEC